MFMIKLLSFLFVTTLSIKAIAADKYIGPEGVPPKKPSCIDALTELHFTQRLADVNEVRIAQALIPFLKSFPEEVTEQITGEIIHLTDLNPEVFGFFLDFLRGVKAEDGHMIHAPIAPEEFLGLVHALTTQNFDSTLILHAYKLVDKDPGVFYQNMLDGTFNGLRLKMLTKKTIN